MILVENTAYWDECIDCFASLPKVVEGSSENMGQQ